MGNWFLPKDTAPKKLQQHLPYFQLYDEYVSAQTTVRDLLCHRVGLGTFSGDIIWYKSKLTAEEIIRRVRYLEPAYGFRAGYGYSNVMYVTAGKIIEEVSGMAWGDFVNTNFFQPLGMNRTISSIGQLESKGNFASPHTLSEEKNQPIEWTDWNSVAPMGGIISSIEDMSKWMIFNLNYGILNGDTLLAPEVFDQLWKPWNSYQVNLTDADSSSHFSGYGLGWGVTDYYGRLRVGHSGGYDGMISYMQLLPEEKLGVIVLTNGLKTPVRAVVNYIIDGYLGLPEKDLSAEYLQKYLENVGLDGRIAEREKSRIEGTEPTLPPDRYTGTYFTEVYGNIYISSENGQLNLQFEHSPALNAKLSHWHYDVWKIEWEKDMAWFDFGTIQFNLTNNLQVKSITFDVPNDDIWFYELKPIKVNQE